VYFDSFTVLAASCAFTAGELAKLASIMALSGSNLGNWFLVRRERAVAV